MKNTNTMAKKLFPSLLKKYVDKTTALCAVSGLTYLIWGNQKGVKMFRVLFLVLPVLYLTSCASFISAFSLGSMVSGETRAVMPSERKAIIQEAKNETLKELDQQNKETVEEETMTEQST